MIIPAKQHRPLQSIGDRLCLKVFLCRQIWRRVLLLPALLLCCALAASRAGAEAAQDLDRAAIHALQTLYRTNQLAAEMSQEALAILVFPSMVKADQGRAGSTGDGVMMQHGAVVDHYSSVASAWAMTADAPPYSYVVFLMTRSAVEYAAGMVPWETGAGPAVVLVNEGAAKNLLSASLKGSAYAFVFRPQGPVPTASFDGTKISKIKR